MKKVFLSLTAIALMLTLAGCSKNEEQTPTTPSEDVASKTYEVSSNGYGGEMKLKVTVNGTDIKDIEMLSDHETAPIFERAFPIIKERIVNADTPIVDNVSGATFSSWAVKQAVGTAMKQNGQDFGQININTEPVHEKKQMEDVHTGLVIVGGGPAGLAAAISAKENGLDDIIVVEKLDILSGNGKMDMNFFDLYRSEATIKNGTDVSKEQFIEDHKDYYDGIERVERWADEAYDLDEWLRGMDINLNFNYGDGDNHMAEADEYAGNHIQTGLEKAIKDANIEVRTGTKGTDLLMEDGKAIGVAVETRDGYYNIYSDAVIIATGGFSGNQELIKEYAPDYVGYPTSNLAGATGDFVPEFIENDLKLDRMGTLSIFTNILEPRKDLTGGADLAFRVYQDGTPTNPDNEVAYYITDQAGYDSFYRIRKHVNLGYYEVADTLEELANKLGVDYAGLKNTIDTYNANPENERKFAKEGPFYGTKVRRAIHMTKGGVVANENAEVINNNDEVVPGLYAAGEVTRTQGAYSAAVVFGKVSGEEAAKFVLNK